MTKEETKERERQITDCKCEAKCKQKRRLSSSYAVARLEKEKGGCSLTPGMPLLLAPSPHPSSSAPRLLPGGPRVYIAKESAPKVWERQDKC
jgi:hypothetical protein